MTIDINSSEFKALKAETVDDFLLKKGTIGIIGRGFVGKAAESFFKDHFNVLVYDKSDDLSRDSFEKVVMESELIFVCVPTPMNEDGSCHTDIVRNVVREINDLAVKNKRNLDSFIVIIKSTVTPGTTEELYEKYYPLRLMFSPEYLTEKNAVKDFKFATRHIFGGELEDADVVMTYYYVILRGKIVKNETVLIQVPPTVAELAKYTANGFIASKVTYFNEIQRICSKLGVEYSELRFVVGLDPRIGHSFTQVPGPDGDFGYGGKCIFKDLNALISLFKSCEVEQKLLSDINSRNLDFRTNKDWEEIPGVVLKKE